MTTDVAILNGRIYIRLNRIFNNIIIITNYIRAYGPRCVIGANQLKTGYAAQHWHTDVGSEENNNFWLLRLDSCLITDGRVQYLCVVSDSLGATVYYTFRVWKPLDGHVRDSKFAIDL